MSLDAGMVYAVVTLTALLAAAVVTVVTGRPSAAWALLGLSALWLSANAKMEGPVLIRVTRDHGLVLADLLSVAGGCLALGALVLRYRRVRQQRS